MGGLGDRGDDVLDSSLRVKCSPQGTSSRLPSARAATFSARIAVASQLAIAADEQRTAIPPGSAGKAARRSLPGSRGRSRQPPPGRPGWLGRPSWGQGESPRGGVGPPSRAMDAETLPHGSPTNATVRPILEGGRGHGPAPVDFVSHFQISRAKRVHYSLRASVPSASLRRTWWTTARRVARCCSSLRAMRR